MTTDKHTQDIDDELLSAGKVLSEIQEAPFRWILFPYIPREEVTLIIAQDKTSKNAVVADILGGLTSGNAPDLFSNYDPSEAEPEKVLYLTEDIHTLKKRLTEAGGNTKNVCVFENENALKKIDFSNSNGNLERILKIHKPTVVLMDPLQDFIPKNVRETEPNQMRRSLNTLNFLSAKYKTTFILLCQSSKRAPLNPRAALPESSDVWNFARSILFVGHTGAKNNTWFVSHEKSNYAKEGKTVLFTISDSGIAEFAGVSTKKFSKSPKR